MDRRHLPLRSAWLPAVVCFSVRGETGMRANLAPSSSFSALSLRASPSTFRYPETTGGSSGSRALAAEEEPSGAGPAVALADGGSSSSGASASAPAGPDLGPGGSESVRGTSAVEGEAQAQAADRRTDPSAPSDGFGSAFVNALGMIFATEIGDRTFFIAAIMAMSHPRLVVFGGAIGALTVMTVLSAAFGHAVPHLLPKVFTHWASVVLLLYFGCKMLYEASEMYRRGDGLSVSEELEEVEQELAQKGLASEEGGSSSHHHSSADSNSNSKGTLVTPDRIGGIVNGGAKAHELKGLNDDGEFGLDLETGGGKLHAVDTSTSAGSEEDERQGSTPSKETEQSVPLSKMAHHNLDPVYRSILVNAFVLTFVAEWGDRSQIATIALAAAQNAYGVTLGAVVGHSICTGFAVVGGKILARSITERQVALSGGVLFLIFALYTVWVGPQAA
eukprot:g16138.t1